MRGAAQKKEIHSGGSGQSVHLGAATEVEQDINEGLKVGSPHYGVWGRWEARLHVRQGGFRKVGHAGEMGRMSPG